MESLLFKIYVPINMTTQGQHTCQVDKPLYKKKCNKKGVKFDIKDIKWSKLSTKMAWSRYLFYQNSLEQNVTFSSFRFMLSYILHIK